MYDVAEVFARVEGREHAFEQTFGDRRASRSFPDLLSWIRLAYFKDGIVEMEKTTESLRRAGISRPDLLLYADVVEFVGDNYLEKVATDETLTNFASELYQRLRRLGF